MEEQVDPHLLWTIGFLETRFRPWLRSPVGAEGLMQFMPATAARFNLVNPYQPEPAIRAAARYVRFLSNRFGGRIDSILAGYNAGEGAVDAFLWGKTRPFGQKNYQRARHQNRRRRAAIQGNDLLRCSRIDCLSAFANKPEISGRVCDFPFIRRTSPSGSPACGLKIGKSALTARF